MQRPAEIASIVAAIVAVAAILGLEVTEEQTAAITAVVGLVAAAVTWYISRRQKSGTLVSGTAGEVARTS